MTLTGNGVETRLSAGGPVCGVGGRGRGRGKGDIVGAHVRVESDASCA